VRPHHPHRFPSDLQAVILEALERDVRHPNAVRLALERRREQRGQAPQVDLALPEHVQRRDAPVWPHALETYDQLKERSALSVISFCARASLIPHGLRLCAVSGLVRDRRRPLSVE
jgi:hypothetical protein